MGAAVQAPEAVFTPTTLSVRAIVDLYIQFVGRCLRNLGVPSADVEDAIQAVFLAAASKHDRIAAGAERAFLFSAALNIASKVRRTYGRRREVFQEELLDRPDPAPSPEAAALRSDAGAAVDRALGAMEEDLRAVFVLFEIEELSSPEIAETLGIPVGTVASRLRRAREEFRRRIKRSGGV